MDHVCVMVLFIVVLPYRAASHCPLGSINKVVSMYLTLLSMDCFLMFKKIVETKVADRCTESILFFRPL